MHDWQAHLNVDSMKRKKKKKIENIERNNSFVSIGGHIKCIIFGFVYFAVVVRLLLLFIYIYREIGMSCV